MANQQQRVVDNREQTLLQFLETRERSLSICAPLQVEDYVIQTMPDVSPPKWHLAHTSWFYETFILAPFDSCYTVFHPQYDTLFNSYYVTHGNPYPRDQRGLLSRPTVEEVVTYRHYVDTAMQKIIHNASDKHWFEISSLLMLGINHEQQHQELLLTDIKHIFAHNPLKPVYKKTTVTKNTSNANLIKSNPNVSSLPMSWVLMTGGTVDVGHAQSDCSFAYDNESPVHKVYLEDFKLASRCVTNQEYIHFINDDGYQKAEVWLSDGWAMVQQEKWSAPLYWEKQEDNWHYVTLAGLKPVDLNAPVCHVSFYEADAFASWANKRLPTEYEWELAASQLSVEGNLFEAQNYQPIASPGDHTINQMFGDVWEWTASPYTAYPGYKATSGSIGEYNGKFMSSQMVLRGGSFATAKNHIRATYRNFFYPKDRWQFSGIRLADNI